LVHGDVKPANILIQEDARARLTDFGLAARPASAESLRFRAETSAGSLRVRAAASAESLRFRAEASAESLRVRAEASAESLRVRAEASAESLRVRVETSAESLRVGADAVDARADLYSLGGVMAECVAGRRPVAPPSAVPPGLAGVIAKLLAEEPADRYQSCAGLIADLGILAAAPDATPVLGRFDEPAGQRRQVPLTGRARELAALLERWDTARDGHGGAVLLSGAPGSGKSRLLDELTTRVGGDGFGVLRAACARDAPPLAPLRAAVDAYLAACRQLAEPRRSALLHRVRAAAGYAAPLLARLSPALADTLSVAVDDEGHEAFSHAVAVFLAELARTSSNGADPREGAGLLLCLDDVQWLDGGTRRVLHQMATLLPDAPLLVVATATDPHELDQTGVVDLTVGLAPLDRARTAELIRHAAFGVRIDMELAERLADGSGGIPAATLDHLGRVLDAGLIVRAWHGWTLDVDGLAGVAPFEDMADLVRRRADRLDPPARRLLAAGAVLGRSFAPDLAARIGEFDRVPADAIFAAAIGQGVLEFREARYAFVHESLRAALLDGVDETELSRLHQRAALALEANPSGGAGQVYALAGHYLRGATQASPARVFGTCAAAGTQALADLAPAEAVGYFEQALALAAHAEPDALAQARTGLGAAYHRIGRYADALRVLSTSLAAAPGGLSRARIGSRIASVHRDLWDAPAALSAVHQALAALGRPLPRRLVPLALAGLAALLAGLFVEWTGWGFGSARGSRRERYRLRAELLESGALAALLDHDTGRSVPMLLAALYPAARLGPSHEYVSIRAAVAGYRQILRWGRPRRGMARVVAAAAQLADPAAAAWVGWSNRVAPYLAGRGDIRHLARDVTTDTALIAVGPYVSVVGTGCVQLTVAGRTRDAQALHEAVRARLTGVPSGVDSQDQMLSVTAAMVCAAQGQVTEAADALRQAAADPRGLGCRSRWSILLLARLQAALERRDLGAHWDEFAVQAAQLGRRALFVSHRSLYVYLSYARIEQALGAPAERRAAAVAAARDAVHWLGRFAGSPRPRRARGSATRQPRRARGTKQLAAHHRVACAYLRHLAGDHEGALDALAAADRVLRRAAAPLASFEAARLRARANAAAGRSGEALGHAMSAVFTAEQEGWPHRARWIREEFAAAPPAGAAHPSIETNGVLDRRRLAALEQMSLAASRTLDPAELARIALDEMIRILAAERAYLFLGEPGGALLPHLGRDGAGNDLALLAGAGPALVEQVWRSGEPVVVTGAGEEPARGPRSVMAAPLQVDGRLLGVVYLDSRVAKGIFTRADIGLLGAVANQLAAALETARAAQLALAARSAKRQREVAETLRDASARLSAVLDPDEVLRQLCATLRAVATADQCWLVRVDGEKLTVWREADDPAAIEVLGERSAALAALLTAAGPIVGRPGTAPPLAVTGGTRVRSWLAVPLRDRDGTAGLVLVGTTAPGAYRDTDVEIAAALAGQGMLAYHNARLFAQVRLLASTDALTGLANRRRFVELADHEVALTRRRGTQCTAMMVVIDQVGDQVIRTVARRLRHTLRTTDLLGRSGGGEFALLLPDAGTGSRALAQRLCAAIANTPVDTDAGPVRVTVSVGVAYLHSDDPDTASLLSRADLAMNRAREAGRNRVVVIDETPDDTR
ncbi:MAG: hypothetical protein V7603_5282, partial [Micromonosporaceae bacterium]